MSEEIRRYTFHFCGTEDTFMACFSDADRNRLFGEAAGQYGFVTFNGPGCAIVNMQNVTFVEVRDLEREADA